MLVTELLRFGKDKIKVYVDEEYLFWLYKSEINSYGLIVGEEVLKEKIDCILKETVIVRAKKKALSILERSDRTEAQLHLKLKQAGYSESIINEAISYVKRYHYIDDKRFTEYYIRSHIGHKSRCLILNKLMQKGIEQDMIRQSFEQIEAAQETGENPELSALKKEIEKRMQGRDQLSREDLRRLFAALCRKGFSYEMIQRELSMFDFTNYE